MHAERRRDMRLAGARPADQDDILGHIDKVTSMKLADEGFIDLAAGKVEARQVAVAKVPTTPSERPLVPEPARCLRKAGGLA